MMHEDKFIGGIVGNQIDKVSDSITNGIVNGFYAILEITLEIGYWACSVGILLSVLIFICSKDPKSVSFGVKCGFVLLIIAIIRSSYER